MPGGSAAAKHVSYVLRILDLPSQATEPRTLKHNRCIEGDRWSVSARSNPPKMPASEFACIRLTFSWRRFLSFAVRVGP